MVGFILHINKYSSAEYKKSGDKLISENCNFHCNNSSKQESIYASEISTCISNSNITTKSCSSQKIVELYKKSGTSLLNDLDLEFTFGLFDNDKKIFFGARDRIGIKPFYYYKSDDLFIYSSEIKFIKDYLGVKELSEDWILSSLSGSIYDKTTSQIKEIKKLPPAHSLIIKDGKLSISKYWELNKKEYPILSDKDYILELRSKLISAVEKRLIDNVGAELSGGLDSSAIVAIAARANEKVNTYTHSLPDAFIGKIAPYKDERYYRDILVSKYQNIESHNIDAENKGLFAELQDELRLQSVPVNNTLSFLSDSLLDTAKQNKIDTLFSGFGGDEGLSNFGNIIPYQYAKSFNIRALKRAIGSSYYSKSFISNLILPHLGFLRKKKSNWQKENFKLFFLNPEFANTVQLTEKYWSFRDSRSVETMNEFLSLKLNENYISNRAEITGASARHRGIEYTFPLLDVDLIEYYYALPDRLKYRNGIGRYAYREVIKEFVPPEIYQRTSKMGATVPNVLVRFLKDYQKIEAFLQSSRHGKASAYINFDKMIANMKLIKQYSEGKKIRANQHIFFNALMLVLYLENEY